MSMDRYEEALERARIEVLVHPECRKIWEDIFPELRESEDERIRRKMIEHFKSKTKETWCNMPVKDILAYLEKQKEQKLELNKESFKEELRYWFGQVLCCYENKGCPEDEMSEVADEYVDKATERLLSKVIGKKEQKPAEWSEEDENVIETLIRELRLNAQFEFAVRKLGLDYVQTLTVLDKCRRLRPHPSWKPSAPQMRALREAVDEWDGFAGQPTLESLYNDLKKLM